ncbi:MAG: DUF5016 domain-containing protein [Prevotella sp.]|jgi:hypothetical protein|nr:DUF5016 domain-containing protein [Prevotella sp.]
MKSIYKTIICGLCACLLFTSCEEEDTRTTFPHSTPVIESATINPSTFAYGDSVVITAKVSDSTTPLSSLEMKMIVNDVLIAQQSIRTSGNSAEVSSKFKVAYTSELPEDATIEVLLTLINVEGDETAGSIAGLKGKRTYYNKLYMVLDNGGVFTLTPQAAKSDKYESPEVMIKSNSLRYRIAEKLTADNQIDFTGHVWGLKAGAIQLVDETGDYIITTSTTVDYITGITFDNYMFETAFTGDKLNPNDLVLDNFGDVTASGEAFKKLSRSFEKNQDVNLFDELTSTDIVYDLNYFERTSDETVKFIGDAGSYDLYYSETRKVVIVDPADRAYPNVLLAAGEGLGYPSKVKEEAHTTWDFNAPLQAIVFRKVATDIYQAVVYFDATKANFKPFENRDWANEKKSSDYTMPSLIAKDTDLGKDDGNWYAADGAVSGNYKITINLATKVVTAESVTLP